MRHLGSLLTGLVVTPLAWVLIAYGQGHTYRSWNDDPAHAYWWYEPVVFLAVAGLLIGLLASTRISPVGPLFAGAVYLTAGVGGLANETIYKLVPKGFTITLGGLDRTFALRTPIDTGTAILLGVALLVAVVSIGRWRAWPAATAGAVAAPVEVVEGAAEEPVDGSDSATEEAPTAPQWLKPEGGSTPLERRYVSDGDDDRTMAQHAAASERAADLTRVDAERRADAERAASEARTTDEPSPAGGSPWSAPPSQAGNQD
jgi:hypothetical protein